MEQNNNHLVFYKYRGGTKVREVKLPPVEGLYQDEIFVDNEGNIWFDRYENSYLKVRMCDDVPVPRSISLERDILKAEGCSSTIWRWKEASGRSLEEFTAGNELAISNKEAIYYARCVKEGCSSREVEFSIVPRITELRFEKEKICSGSAVSLHLTAPGVFLPGNDFYIQVYNETGGLVSEEKLEISDDNHQFTNRLPAGKYYAKIRSSAPEIISAFRVPFEIQSLPSISISQKYVLGGVELSVPEIPAVQYEWLEDGKKMEGEETAKLFTNKPLKYVAGIYDEVCRSYSGEHRVETALANEDSGLAVRVLENPGTEGYFRFMVNNPEGHELVIQVTDAAGKEISTRRYASGRGVSRPEADLRAYPAGTYRVTFKAGSSVVTKTLVRL